MSGNGSYNRKTVNVKQIHSNVEQQLIQITEDKLENILLKYIKNLNIKNSWISPASIFITVVIAKTTATFTDSLGLSAAVWESIFILVGVGSLIWLVRNLIHITKNWDISSISHLICKIKNSDESKDS